MEPTRVFVEVEVDDGWFVLEEATENYQLGEAKVKEGESKANAEVNATETKESKCVEDAKRVELKTPVESKTGVSSWSDIVRSMEAKQKPIVHNETQARPRPDVRRAPKTTIPVDDIATPKEWAQTSRARKFGETGTGSGNTFWDPPFSSFRPTSTLTKTVRLVSGMSPADEKAWKAPTKFEIEAEMVYPLSKRNTTVKFSMDKKKRWDWVDELATADSDLVVPIGMEKRRRGWESGKYEANSYVLLQPETFIQKPRKEDKEIAAYLAHLEKNAKVVASKMKHEAWNGRLERLSTIPKGIDCPRMAFTLKPRNAATKLNLRAARVEMDGNNAYWAPKNVADASDYLDVDMGKPVIVTALGTKGRPLLRNSLDEVWDDSPYEWVSRFKAFWKKDEQEIWKPLGDFTANSDAETEVAHVLLNPHTEKPGLELRFLRIQPTAFHHRKCMRIGVYGRALEGEEKEVQENKLPTLDMLKANVVSTSAVVYTVESKLSREKAGKFNFVRSTFTSDHIEKRRVRRKDRAKTRRDGKLDGNEA